MDLESRPQQNLDTAARTIDDAMYVINPHTSELHAFNEVGARIWELLDGQRTVADIAGVVSDEYDVAAAAAEADVLEFLVSLDEKGLIST